MQQLDRQNDAAAMQHEDFNSLKPFTTLHSGTATAAIVVTVCGRGLVVVKLLDTCRAPAALEWPWHAAPSSHPITQQYHLYQEKCQ